MNSHIIINKIYSKPKEDAMRIYKEKEMLDSYEFFSFKNVKQNRKSEYWNAWNAELY